MTDLANKRQGNQQDFACLAIELAAGTGSVAACDGVRTSHHAYPAQSGQSRDIYTGVHEVLRELGLDLEALHCIAFGCGPGAFTGLRVAAAVTQALAYGAKLPVARVSSLAALAAGTMRKHRVDCVVPCFDARMGEAYLALYEGGPVAGSDPTVPDSLVDPGQYRLPDIPFFAAGPGWPACPELLDNHATQIVGSDFDLMPSAKDVLALAARQYRSGQTILPAQALPNYIRNKVTY